jgi:serine/threonine-protein kinase HipA
MRRSGKVFYNGRLAGIIWQDEDGYGFQYSDEYINQPGSKPVSLEMPLRSLAYKSNYLLPFFDNLIPEEFVSFSNTTSYTGDRMELLLSACGNNTGVLTIKEESN